MACVVALVCIVADISLPQTHVLTAMLDTTMANQNTPAAQASYANALQSTAQPSQRPQVCSYCLGAPEGGPPNHFYRQCVLYLTGKPSLNRNWNYSSGPTNFQTSGSVFCPPCPPGLAPAPPLSSPNPELSYLIDRLTALEKKEADKIAKAEKEAQEKKKRDEWNQQLKQVSDACVESARREMSPIKKALSLLQEANSTPSLRSAPVPEVEEGEITGRLKPKTKKRTFAAFDDPDNKNSDDDSIFKHKDGVSRGGQHLNVRHCMSLMSVVSGDDFEAWADKHLNEETDRAFEYLASIATERGIDFRGIKRQTTLIKKISADYDSANKDL